jgi:hypothetical protein
MYNPYNIDLDNSPSRPETVLRKDFQNSVYFFQVSAIIVLEKTEEHPFASYAGKGCLLKLE